MIAGSIHLHLTALIKLTVAIKHILRKYVSNDTWSPAGHLCRKLYSKILLKPTAAQDQGVVFCEGGGGIVWNAAAGCYSLLLLFFFIIIIPKARTKFPKAMQNSESRFFFDAMQKPNFSAFKNQTQPPCCVTHVAAIFVIAIPVAILIQLLTWVYSAALSEDSRGCKLYLGATSTVRKSHYSGQKSQYVSGNPGGTWKLKNHLHRAAIWSKWSYALVRGKKKDLICCSSSCVSHYIHWPEGTNV